MTTLRTLAALILAAATVFAVLGSNAVWLAAAATLGLALRVALWENASRALRSALPIVLFAGALALLRWVSHTPISVLPLKTVAVFLLSTAAMRIFPWTRLSPSLDATSKVFTPWLFALFVRHFADILAAEAGRVFQARALCVTRPYGAGALRSLVAALGAVFSRALTRAERFYAAQFLRGLAA